MSLLQARLPGEHLPREVQYVVLLFALFVVPRLLIRYRLPTAVTSLALGAAAGLGFNWFHDDTTIQLLSGLGIVALFLFAGLDVSFEELQRERGVVAQHLLILGVTLALATWAAVASLHLPLRPAILVALALLTPSTGISPPRRCCSGWASSRSSCRSASPWWACTAAWRSASRSHTARAWRPRCCPPSSSPW